jgi:hypothetical protein
MANASPDLIWGVVRDTSCHILKARQSGRTKVMGQRGAEFTMEPNNPTGLNSWKYSGLANAKTVDVTPVEGGVLLTSKSKDAKRVGKVSAELPDRSAAAACRLPASASTPFPLARWHMLLAHLCRHRGSVVVWRMHDAVRGAAVAAKRGRDAPCAALLGCSLLANNAGHLSSRVAGPPPPVVRSRRRRSTRPPLPRISAASPRPSSRRPRTTSTAPT